ncbi:MAG: hypothetical protein ABFR90_10800 [Planctomycetota bacterium]
MKCPNCNAELASGVVKIHGGILGFLFGSFQRPDCWFIFDNKVQEIKVVPNRSARKAMFCSDCETAVILNK